MDLEQILQEAGAVMKGHFILSSGRHSDTYIEKFRILEQPAVLTQLCKEIARHFVETEFDFVAGPTTGGIIIAFEVAKLMGKGAIYVESEDGIKKLRRNKQLPSGAKVLVVDDVLTTGISTLEVANVIQDAGAVVVGIGVLIDRSETPPQFDVPVFASYRIAATSFLTEDVPEWLSRVPVSKPGTRLA